MRIRIIVDGSVLCVADEDPGLGRLAYVCSACYHEPEYDDPETCPEHPNAPLERVRKLTADMLQAGQVTAGSGTPTHIAAHQSAPVDIARQIELTSIAAHQGAPAAIARQTKPSADPFQTYLPFLGGGMPRNAQLRQLHEWAKCTLLVMVDTSLL